MFAARRTERKGVCEDFMRLIEAACAYMTAEEMGRQVWPYDMALALVKVKRATKAGKKYPIYRVTKFRLNMK